MAELRQLHGPRLLLPLWLSSDRLPVEVARQRGDGGVIAFDRSGAVTMAFNSPGMKRAVAGAGRQPFAGIR
ncbi:isoaspartyl peptidase/L-asparaginase [uncultured Erythrobacter sp.]|uniref:isoaspartyl peptidase/L-asparaginase n=1 Tax=uncultured Erythrobacter sp. TaxID=263913 RepID=UPI002658E763|nr:isoaspartyl peptidase/L-asparaginase [uncultured Erythrobacter sp.]